MSPRTSSIVQIIFFFWSFDISEGILRNQKKYRFTFIFKPTFNIFGPIWVIRTRTSLCIDYPVERCKITVILFGSMLPNLGPSLFFINMFSALKGSQFYLYLLFLLAHLSR